MNTQSYRYKGFHIFVTPDRFIRGHDGWSAVPVSWRYRIDRIPGKYGIVKGGGIGSIAEAEFMAEETIDSWN